MTQLAILGAGLGCREVLPLIRRLEIAGHRLSVISILDDNYAMHGQEVCGFRVQGAISSWSELPSGTMFVNSIGTFTNPRTRRDVVKVNKIPEDLFISLQDPAANVMVSDSEIGVGSIIYAGTTVMPGTNVGKFAVLSPNSTIGVKNSIGDFSLFAAGVTTGTDVSVGEFSFVGSGATIAPGITLGMNSFVGVGSVVFRDVEDGHQVLGNPARVFGRR